jgi:glycosyltransferase involved in cell wall biosynthesis
LSPDRVVMIPNGVDTSYFRPEAGRRDPLRRELGIPAEVQVVGTIGNLLPVKGQSDLLRAVARLGSTEQTRLVIVGDGRERGRLEALARELELSERVLFTGTRPDTRELLSSFDVVVSPSHSEGMSNVLLEAMAMARPIVATAVGGSSELLRHEETGLLVPPQDPESLAAAIRRVLQGGPEIEALARRARKVVEVQFGLDRMIARYVALYDELLER